MGDVEGPAQAAASVANTSATDATNREISQQNNAFNAQQAGITRDWSAQQAQQNRDFQAGQQIQAEQYNTQMSDTQMQRRVTDLKAAGINPLLAAGNLGGASSPTMSAPGGATATGAAQASSAGLPRIQGDPVLSGLAGLKLTNAQAANTNQQTTNLKVNQGILEDQRDMWDADTTPENMLKRTQVVAATYDLQYGQASMVNEVTNTIRNASIQSDQNVAFNNIRNSIAQMDADTQKATMSELIKMQNATNTQQTQEAANITAAQSGLLGKTIAYAQAIMTPVGQAAGAANSAAGAARHIAEAGAL